MIEGEIMGSNSYCFSDTLTKIYYQIKLRSSGVSSAPSRSAIAILIDRSGSMHGEKLSDAKEAAKLAVNALGSNNFVSLYSFSTKTDNLVPFTKAGGKDKILNSIDKIKASGGTFMYNALDEVYHDAKDFSSDGGSVTLIVLTDGQPSDVGDVKRYEQLAAAGSEFGMKIVCVGIGDYDETILKAMADASNGDFINAIDRNSITGAFTKYASEAATSGGTSAVLKLIPRESGAIEIYDQTFSMEDGIAIINLGTVGADPINATGSVSIKGGAEGNITGMQAVLSYRDNDGSPRENTLSLSLIRTKNSELVVSNVNKELINEARLKMQMGQVEYLIARGDFDSATRISRQAMESANATKKREFIEATKRLDRVLDDSMKGNIDKKEAYNQTTRIKRQ